MKWFAWAAIAIALWFGLFVFGFAVMFVAGRWCAQLLGWA